MLDASHLPIDPVEELRLRRWARENYVSAELRDSRWHPVVLDEMQQKDQDAAAANLYPEIARRVVPLTPDQGVLRGPHIEPARYPVLLRVPALD